MSASRFLRSRRKHSASPSLGLGRASLVGVAESSTGTTQRRLALDCEESSTPSVMSALQQMLESEGMTVRASVVVSSHYCRYLSLPWSDALLDNAAGSAYLRQAFADVYGDRAGDWEIAVPDMPYGQTVVACGIERSILDALRDPAIVSRLTNVRPYFSAALDAFRKQITSADAVFALIEEGLMTVGRICGRAVVEVEVLPAGDAWPAILVAWLSRTALLEGEPGTVYVLCPPVWRGDAPEGTGADWHFLEWPDAVRALVADDPALALAACMQ